MTNKQQIISKGPYTHSQISNFLTVKQYIFLRKNGEKCLLLKFLNETDFFMNSVKFKLVQLNSEGKVICRQNVLLDGFNLGPGAEYMPSSRIVVNDKCADFKIVIDYVDSGYYRYRLRRGKVVSFYNPPETRESKSLSSKDKDVFNVSSYRAEKRKSIAFIASVVAILISLFTVISCVVDILIEEFFEEAEAYENSYTVCESDEILYEEDFGVDNA